jgi:hypothetical protein
MLDINSASQRRRVRGSGSSSPEESLSLKSRWTKSRAPCDMCNAAGNVHDKCKHGCNKDGRNEAQSHNGDNLGAGSASDNSSNFSAPGSAWELNIKCTKTRNPVALGILWNAECKNDESNTGCKTDRGTEIIIYDEH